MTEMTVYFAIPGDIDTPSGGYHYDRRVIAELREKDIPVQLVTLPHCSLHMQGHDRDRVRAALEAIPDQSPVIIDGLAFGCLDDIAAIETSRLRLVALCHHPLALETGLDEQQQKALLQSERRSLQCTRLVLVTSEHTRQLLVSRFGVPADKVVVARPGTDRSEFSACTGNPLRLLTLASFTPRKAHDVLISALAELTSLDWQARFIGSSEFDPAWTQRLHEQVQAAGLAERITFCAPVAHPQQEYLNADLFVLPSRFEGYGMVFAEALAAGLPVVAATGGAVPEVVPATAGVLVPPDDVGALTEALRDVLSSQTLRKELQAGARQAAESLPRWSETATIVARALQELPP